MPGVKVGTERADTRARAPAGLARRPVHVFAPSDVRTARLLLRELSADDAGLLVPAIREAGREPEKWFPAVRPGQSPRAVFDLLLAGAEEGARTGGAWRRAVWHESGAFVGLVGLGSITRGLSFEGDATWWIAAPHRGRGYAREAVQAMLDIAFDDLPRGLGLHRVVAMIEPGNLPSLSLARRLGFRRVEGVTTSGPVRGSLVPLNVYERTIEEPRA